jgi:hypothetical protein
MLKRHEDALMTRFDAVVKVGWAHIEYWELYLWYSAARLGKKTRRDLKNRFDEVNEDAKGSLYVYESEHGILLIHSEGLKTMSEFVGESNPDD